MSAAPAQRAEAHARDWIAALDKAFDLDAERGVLGGLLLNPEKLSLIPSLWADHFYDRRHHAVFAAIRQLEARKVAIDLLTVELELEKMGKLEACGGVAFLGNLAAFMPGGMFGLAHVDEYAKVVREHAITRDILLACSRVGEMVAREALAGEELLDETIGELSRIDRPLELADMTIASVVAKEMTAIDVWMGGDRDESKLPRIPWGIPTVDRDLGGAPIGQVAVVGARPGVGKSTWLINFAMRTPEPGVVFSNEDDPEQDLSTFFLSWQARVDSRRIFERNLTQIDWRQLQQGKAILEKRSHVHLRRCAGMSWNEIDRQIRYMVHKYGIRWWALDYLQQVKGDPKVQRTYQIQHVCEGAQRNAAELGLAGIITSQLLRPEERDSQGRQQTPQRPTMRSLKDSSAIEACSKQILLLHPNPEKPRDQLEVLVPKFRRGAGLLMFDVSVDYRYSLLDDLHATHRPPQTSMSPPGWDDAPPIGDGDYHP
jgi:replicative DNA helicase